MGKCLSLKILTRPWWAGIFPPMLSWLASKITKPVSALMVALVLSAVGMVALHHHDHHDGAEDHCTICFVEQILSSSNHTAVIVELAKPVLALAFRQFCKIIPLIQAACLHTLCIHGPPLV
jgi:hypothetical protein